MWQKAVGAYVNVSSTDFLKGPRSIRENFSRDNRLPVDSAPTSWTLRFSSFYLELVTSSPVFLCLSSHLPSNFVANVMCSSTKCKMWRHTQRPSVRSHGSSPKLQTLLMKESELCYQMYYMKCEVLTESSNSICSPRIYVTWEYESLYKLKMTSQVEQHLEILAR